MAALQGSFVVQTVAIVGGTPQTVLQIATPTNQRVKILKTTISFDGTNSANTPALVTIERQTGGTFSTTVVGKKTNDPTGSLETIQTTAKTAVSVAPTDSDILETYNVPVFGGLAIEPQSPGQELLIPGNTLIGWKVAASANVNCTLTVLFEE